MAKTYKPPAVLPGDPGYDAMRVCRLLNVVSLVLAVAVLAYPWPSQVLAGLLASVPVFAVVAAFASGGEITLGAVAGTIDTRPTAVHSLWLPAVSLALYAYWVGPYMLRPMDVLWAGLIGCVASMVFILLADPIVRYSPPRCVPLIGVVFIYAASVAPLINGLLDRAAPLGVSSAQVLEQHAKSGRATNYYLGLSAWGPMRQATEVQVPWEVYKYASVGGLVCVTLHPGALGMPWYDIALCT
jgi:hypothetical protein